MKHNTGPSTFVKVLIPLVFVGIAVFQVISNHGHVDDNVIGALVFIGVGGTAGYAIDRIIQNLYWARTTGGVDRQHALEDEDDDPRPPRPRQRPSREKCQPARPGRFNRHPGLYEEVHDVPEEAGPPYG